jgi:hypothetical protein
MKKITLTRKQRIERREQWKNGQRECMHPVERICPSLQILGSAGVSVVSQSVTGSETDVRRRFLLLQETFYLTFHQPLVYLISTYLEEQAFVFSGKRTRQWTNSSKKIVVDLVAYLYDSSEKSTTCFLLLRRGPFFSIFGTGPKTLFQAHSCSASDLLRNQPIICYQGVLNSHERSTRILWTRHEKGELKLLSLFSKFVCENRTSKMWFKWKVGEKVQDLTPFLENCVDQMRAWMLH